VPRLCQARLLLLKVCNARGCIKAACVNSSLTSSCTGSQLHSSTAVSEEEVRVGGWVGQASFSQCSYHIHVRNYPAVITAAVQVLFY
jgi:hypothetical protein